MKKTSVLIFSLLAILMVAGPAARAADPVPTPVDMVGLGPYKVNLMQMGSGPYTVIFESGFASDLTVWRKVAPEVAKSARVVLYSRAGTGRSDARPQAQTLEAATSELEQLVSTAGLKPPFILVGHSYGGFLIRSYAARHPEQVAGMVHVDPSAERLYTELKKIDPARVQQDENAGLAMVPPAFKDELKLVQAIFDKGALALAGPLPDVPTVVLSSVMARDNPELFIHSPQGVQIWRAQHEAFFSQFTNGSHIVTANSGHNIQLEEPGLVVGAIGQVISGAASQARRLAYSNARKALLAAVEVAARGPDTDASLDLALKESQFGEGDINAVGYDLFGKLGRPDLAELVLKRNAELHAKSANARDSYGEILMKRNKVAEASAQFKLAIGLEQARDGGANPRALAGYRKSLEQAMAAEKTGT